MIAAITSCTNTSNPQVMVGAGLLAKKAIERGLTQQARGSRRASRRARRSSRSTTTTPGLDDYLDELGFHTVGYGCTTCIGNSGPLPEAISGAVDGGRPRRLLRALRQPQLRGADPPRGEGELPRLAAARRRVRARGPHGHRPAHRAASARRPGRRTTSSCATSGRPRRRSDTVIASRSTATCSRSTYADVFTGDDRGARLPVPEGELFAWDAGIDLRSAPAVLRRTCRWRCSRPRTSPAHAASSCSATRSRLTTSPPPARSSSSHLQASTCSSTGWSERTSTPTARAAATTVMVRGLRANVRLRNLLVPGSEGTWTVHLPGGEEMTIFEASQRYLAEGTPTIIPPDITSFSVAKFNTMSIVSFSE